MVSYFLYPGLIFSNSLEPARSHTGGRTLNSVDDSSGFSEDNWLLGVALFAAKWFLHALVVLTVLVRVFVFGEPVTRPHSNNAVLFWRQRNQADEDLAKVQLIIIQHLYLYEVLVGSKGSVPM